MVCLPTGCLDPAPQWPALFAVMKTLKARYESSLPLHRSGSLFVSALSVTALAALATVAGSCATEAPASDEGLRLVMAEIRGCGGLPNGHQNLGIPEDAAEVVVRVHAGADEYLERFTSAAASAGSVRLDGIAPGDYSVDVALCDSANRAIWVGTSDGMTVEANTKSFPNVFLTPVGKTACTTAGAVPPLQGAFAATAVVGGRAYVIGGVTQGQTLTESSANNSIAYFDASKGTVSAGWKLENPRFGAYADATSDGRIRIAGGATAFKFAGVLPVLQPIGAPACALEVLDPVAGTVSCATETTTLAPWPTVAPLSGALLAVGGWDNAPSNEVKLLSETAATVSDSLSAARFQPAVMPFGTSALVFGGVPAAGVPLSQIAEVVELSQGALSVQPVTYNGTHTEFPAFASGAYTGLVDGAHTFVMMGGFDATNAFVQGEASQRIDLLTLDESNVMTSVPLDAGAHALSFQRGAGQLAVLGDGTFVLAGGLSARSEPNLDCEVEGGAVCSDAAPCAAPLACEAGVCKLRSCIRQAVVHFRVDPANATLEVIDSQDITVGALGANLAVLGDGALLVTAGIDAVQSWAVPAESELLRFPGPLDALCVPAQ